VALLSGWVAEWFKAHAWKACLRQKRNVGSNPTPSVCPVSTYRVRRGVSFPGKLAAAVPSCCPFAQGRPANVISPNEFPGLAAHQARESLPHGRLTGTLIDCQHRLRARRAAEICLAFQREILRLRGKQAPQRVPPAASHGWQLYQCDGAPPPFVGRRARARQRRVSIAIRS
jgi:hypothetical protein